MLSLCIMTAEAAFPSWAKTDYDMDSGAETQEEEEDGTAAENMEALQDNVLEYDELQEMIRYFNPDMDLSVLDYQQTLEQYMDARAWMKRGQLSADLDREEAEDEGNMEDYAYYASEEAIYKSAAASYQDLYENMQSLSSTSSLRQTERQLTAAAQALMISYDTMRLERETLEKMEELYQKEYDLAQTRLQAGMATEADVMEAEEALLGARASLEALEGSQDEVYRSLCLMVGRETDGSLEIEQIPDADTARVDSYNLQEDTQRAIGNNYTLINERHTSSNGSTSGVNNKKRNLEAAESQLKINMESMYQDLFQKREELKTEKTAYEKAVQEKNLADTKYSLGMLSQTEYLSAEMNAIQAEADYRSANLTLVQAMDTYEWAVMGIADVE